MCDYRICAALHVGVTSRMAAHARYAPYGADALYVTITASPPQTIARGATFALKDDIKQCGGEYWTWDGEAKAWTCNASLSDEVLESLRCAASRHRPPIRVIVRREAGEGRACRKRASRGSGAGDLESDARSPSPDELEGGEAFWDGPECCICGLGGCTEDYIEDHLSQGLGGYCWLWLDDLACADGRHCPYKHAYPPRWTPAQVQEHKSLLHAVEGAHSPPRSAGADLSSCAASCDCLCDAELWRQGHHTPCPDCDRCTTCGRPVEGVCCCDDDEASLEEEDGGCDGGDEEESESEEEEEEE